MTKAERFLAVVGVSIVAGAVLLAAYVRESNPADAAPPGCAAAQARLGQILDQVRFSTSAAHAVAIALDDTSRTRRDYALMIAATRRGFGRGADAAAGPAAARAEHELAQADDILRAQDGALALARAHVGSEQRELSSATPVVKDASRDLRDEDCPALALTLARSGWPKDHLLGDQSDVARLNATISDRLDVALSLILQAQNDVRPKVAAR